MPIHRMVVGINLLTMKKEDMYKRLIHLKSALSTSTGWFPAGPHSNKEMRSLPSNSNSNSRNSNSNSRNRNSNSSTASAISANKRSTGTVVGTSSSSLSNSPWNGWNSGTLMSELLANLLVEDRSLVKEVDLFDDFGRLSTNRKLLLVGTDLNIRSKAQAVHNYQICLQILSKHLHFPPSPYTAEDLVCQVNARQETFHQICSAYHLPPLTEQQQQQRDGSRDGGSGGSSSSSQMMPMVLLSRRRSLSRRLPHTNRSQSAPPGLFQHTLHSQLHSDNNSKTRPSYSYANNKTTLDLDMSLDQQGRRRGSGSSGSSRRGQTLPLPLPLPSSPSSRASRANRSRSYSPSFHRSIAWAEQLVQSKMRRERLRVQRQDRQSRRRSVTLERLKKAYQAEVVVDQKGGGGGGTGGGGGGGGSGGGGGGGGGGGSGYSRNSVENPIGTATPSSSSSSTRPVNQPSVRASRPGVWYPPEPLPSEVEVARRVTVPQITHAQQSAVRDWLVSLGLSILDGEGGYYYQDHAYLEGSCSYANTPPAPPAPAAAAPPPPATTAPPPLPLSRDRLRNGQLWCDLLSLLEPDATMHVHLSHLVHANVQTISQAKENLSRAFWLWRVRRCPPLPLHLLLLPEDVIQGKKQVIWGLLWEIMQCYHHVHVHHHRSEGSSSLSPWPVLTSYYRPTSSTTTTTSSSSSSMVRSKRLDYTLEERRALDQSLLDWLEDVGILSDLLGALPRPLTVLALEAFLKDGTLLCHLTEKVLQLPLLSPTSSSLSFTRHPHSYSQCLANLTKCVSVLRVHRVSTRYLYPGVEEEIARGQWDSLLGLLEDMHLYYDRVVVRSDWPRKREEEEVEEDSLGSGMPTAVVGSSSRRRPPRLVRYPYLGPRRSLSQAYGISGAVGGGGGGGGGSRQSSSSQRVSLDILSPPEEQSQPPPAPSLPPPPPPPPPPSTYSAAFQPRLDLRASLDSLTHPSPPPPAAAATSPSTTSQLTIFPRAPQAMPSHGLGPSHGLDPFTSHGLGPSPSRANRYSAEEMTAMDPALSLLDDDSMKTSDPPARARAVEEEAKGGAGGGGASGSLPRTSLDRLAAALSLDGPDSDGEALLTTSSSTRPPPPPPLASTNNDAAEGSAGGGGGGSDSLTATLQWVEEVIGQSLLPSSSSFSSLNESDYLVQLGQLGRLFSDGVLLVRLVQRLERVDLVAVTAGLPKTNAQKRQNIRRALQCLADRQKRIPLRALAIEEEVAEGEGSALFSLLLLLRKVYPFH
eukprot:scaffold537_cov180-Ochromonas_danica.AAC.53